MLLVRAYMSSEHTDRVIVNLKVLAALKPGDRIYTRSTGFEVAEASWYNTITRWAQGDSRWVNLEAIKTLIQDATRILSTYVLHAWPGHAGTTEPAYPAPTPEQSVGFVKTMVAEMEAAAHGLEQLKTTYEDDSRMLAHLEVTLQKVAHEVGRARACLGPAAAASPSALVHPSIVISPPGVVTAELVVPTSTTTELAVVPAAKQHLPTGGGKASKHHGSINA